ncbi:MAG: type II secretion system protein [Gallionella sp.]
MKPLRVQAGFTYLAMLFAIALSGVVLAEVGINWILERQRDKESQLLFVGNQFRQAIALYYERTPGAIKRYPPKLEDLLTDERYNTPQHYLRKLYNDPITNRAQWGLVIAPDGGIMGVHSLSDDQPIKTAEFDYPNRSFEKAESYSKWRFIYSPQSLIQQQATR